MKKVSFNDGWKFKKIGSEKSAESGNTLSQEKTIRLPHDAMIEEKRAIGNQGGANLGFFPGGDYEYVKRFQKKDLEEAANYILEFEGIFGESIIWVNDVQLERNLYGYTGMKIDITPYLNQEGENVIRVKVVNSMMPNSRWYTGSGIYRPVWIYTGDTLRILPEGQKITTEEITDEVAVIRVKVPFVHEENKKREVQVHTKIFDKQRNCVAEKISPVTILGKEEGEVEQRIFIKYAKLWSVENPNLYECISEILEDDEMVDSDCEKFGIRKISLDPIHGLRINGKEMKLRGGCIHHDNGIIGAATYADAEERRIRILKKAGFNAVRIAHNSSSKAILNACDKLGMLVMDEIYDTWTETKRRYDSGLHFQEHWEKDVVDWIEKDYNHPSVILYSIGNEISDLDKANGRKWNRKLITLVRRLDCTRFVTNAVNSLLLIKQNLSEMLLDLGLISKEQAEEMKNPDIEMDINDLMTEMFGKMNELAAHPLVEEKLKEVYEQLDAIGLNYMRGAYEVFNKKYPDRIYFGSETLPPDIDKNWKCVKDKPQCIGDFTWTAWDYIGEAGVGVTTYGDKVLFAKPYPVFLGYCGDIDITGYRRPMSYYREIVFGLRKKPYIAVQLPEHYEDTARCTPWVSPESIASWSWKGYEGKPCRVEVYSDAPEVELYINGNLSGKQSCGEDNRYKAIFDTIYIPGEIEAVAKYGMECVSWKLKTVRKNKKLVLEPERVEVEKNELIYISVKVCDAEGTIDTDEVEKVNIFVEGTGVLQGFGSADPKSEENFKEAQSQLFYGRALAVIRACDCGDIRVKAQAKQYGMTETIIHVK